METVLVANWAGEKRVTEVFARFGYEHGKAIETKNARNLALDIMRQLFDAGLNVAIIQPQPSKIKSDDPPQFCVYADTKRFTVR